MANGAAGCGWEYRGNSRSSSNGYTCPDLNKTRDGFYCTRYGEHLGMSECHELTFEPGTSKVKTDKIVNHPFRCNQCGR